MTPTSYRTDAASFLAMPFRPALPMNRAVFHRLGRSVGIAIAIAIALSACQARGETLESNEPSSGLPFSANVFTYTDPATGCRYLAIYDNYSSLSKAALTPRLRADGSPDCPKTRAAQ